MRGVAACVLCAFLETGVDLRGGMHHRRKGHNSQHGGKQLISPVIAHEVYWNCRRGLPTRRLPWGPV